MTRVEGIKAKHAIVTPTCRKSKGQLGAGSEAVQRLMEEYYNLSELEVNKDARFHFVLTVERPLEAS
jgi:hypothetical protein